MPSVVWNGTTFHTVTVTGTFLTSMVLPGYAAGWIQFEPTDIAWSTTYNAIAAQSTLGATIDPSGNISIDLFAMDNPGISTNWKWKMSGNVAGLPIPPRLLTVNYANGDSQTLESLLNSSTLA